MTDNKRDTRQFGFGSASIGGLYEPLSEAAAIETIQFAWEQGVRFYDTAPKYGNGLSETRLGKVLGGLPRDQYRIATKVGWNIHTADGQPEPAFSRDGVLRSIEASLRRLNTNYLDIVHIHDPDDHFNSARDETYPALVELKREGVIGAIGAGMNQWEMLSQFLDVAEFDVFLLAGRYTLLDQTAHDFLGRCAASNVPVFIGGVFNSGILATGAVEGARYNYVPAPPGIMQRVQKIEAICHEHQVSLIAAALQFCLAHPAIDRLIVGSRTAHEVRASLAALHQAIPATFWQQLQGAQLIPQGLSLPV